MSWHYLQGREEVSSEAISWDGEQFAPSKSKSTLGTYCLRDSATESCQGSPSGMTLKRSTGENGEDELMSSAAGSHAKTSVAPGKVRALQALEAAYGVRWLGSLARWDRASSSWRTHQCLLFEDSTECLATLPKWGMTQDGVLSERVTPEHPTSETESGCWGGTPNPVEYAKMWPTPRAGNPGSRKPGTGGKVLAEEAKRTWPTPAARDYKGANSELHCTETGTGRKHMDQLPNAVAHGGTKTRRTWLTPKTPTGGGQMERNTEGGGLRKLEDQISQDAGRPTGQLNPSWVEWLMGWPIGFTDLKPLAMDKFRQWLDSHG